MSDDPAAIAGTAIRTTREDWLRAAVRMLVDGGIEQVKVQTLAQQFAVSRSSFYWFFKSRQDLLDALMDHWIEKNTNPLIERARRPAATICESVLNVFECWVNEDLFDPRLDVAVRDWARRSKVVRGIVEKSDLKRVDALAAMFERHNYKSDDAFIRARVLYFMQIGYYSLEIEEPMETRFSYLAAYMRSFTGAEPSRSDLDAFISRFENQRS